MNEWRVGDIGVATVTAGRVIRDDLLRVVFIREDDEPTDMLVRIITDRPLNPGDLTDLGWRSVNLQPKTSICGACEQQKVMEYDQYLCDDCLH